MGSLSCRIVIKKGVAEVFNEDGTPSNLYAEALALVGNQEEALNLWATAYSQDFVAESPITGDNAKLDDVLRFLDTQDSAKRSLTKAQRLELRGMMKENGYFSLSALQKDLVKVFKPKGKTTFNDNKTSQELYSPKEVQEVEPEEVSEVMIEIEGTLRTEDIQITPNPKGGKSLSDPTKKTPIGTSEKISSEQVEREIAESIEDFSNKEEIENTVDNHPNYEALSRPAFFKKYLGMLRRLPNIIFNGVKVTEENRRTYNAVVTNSLATALPIIRAELITLNKISDTTWASKEKATRKVIANLEKDLAKHGVDIIGLSNTKITRRELVEMLTSLKEHLETGDDVVVERFAEIKDLHITPRPASKVMRVNPAYDGLDIVYSENSYPDNYLFEEEGLIKIGENLYHRINREENAINDYVEALYKKVVAGELAVPTEVEDVNDPMNKEELLKDILQFAAQKNTGLKLDNPVEVALAQLVFEHVEIPAPRAIDQLADITTDIEYLKGDFISDFYDYMLQEKLKNSYAYRAILQHFTFAESGITLDYEIDSIQDIEYQKELEDYIRLKRDASMNYLLKNNVGTVATEMKYLNDINSAPEFTDQVQRYKDFIVTPISNQSVIKVGGVLYTNVGSGNGVSVFSEVDMPASSYFYTEVNSEFDRADVDMIIDKQMFIFAPEKLTTEEFEQKQKDNKINTKTPKINKEALQDEKSAKALAIKLQGLDDTPTETAQEYVKSKRLGNNPQLVERVDNLLDTTSELQPTPIAVEDYFSTNEKGEQVISLEKIKDRLPKAYDTLKKYLREPNLNEFRNIVAGEYIKTYKYKVGIANSIEALKELEKISTEIDKIKPLDFISKEEFLQETLAKGEYTTEQKEIMKTLILSLNTDRFPKYATDKNLKEAGIKRTTTDNFYIPDSNVISAGNPAAFVHEIGHFAFGTVLSPEDRIAFLEYVSKKFYGKGAPSLKESIAATSESITYMRDGKMYSYRTNVADNFDEYFAEQFSQWYLGEKVAPEGIRSMFQKVADYLNNIIEKLISKKYIDKELVPFFEKIVKDNTVQKEVILPSDMFFEGVTTSVEEALAEVEAVQRHTNSVAFMNSVGFKLLIKTDIKKIDNC